MTDNHWSYTHSRAVADLLSALDAQHLRIRPHCPWQNGKVERFNRTLQTEWAYRQIFASNDERTQARRQSDGGWPSELRLAPSRRDLEDHRGAEHWSSRRRQPMTNGQHGEPECHQNAGSL